MLNQFQGHPKHWAPCGCTGHEPRKQVLTVTCKVVLSLTSTNKIVRPRLAPKWDAKYSRILLADSLSSHLTVEWIPEEPGNLDTHGSYWVLFFKKKKKVLQRSQTPKCQKHCSHSQPIKWAFHGFQAILHTQLDSSWKYCLKVLRTFFFPPLPHPEKLGGL